jgi:tetratricopeptide (TPR) repeat protein
VYAGFIFSEQPLRPKEGRVEFDVFISYRKADMAFGAAAVYEMLTERFGRDRVFLDNQSMRPGVAYPQSLRSALESMRVLLVLIGPGWLGDDPAGSGLLLIERDGDWVRGEIRRALERAVPIVPVLLDGTALPKREKLPADVRRLTHHQVAEVRHRYLGADIRRLADRVAELLGAGGPGATTAGAVPHQLPAGGGRFVGRDEHLARLDALLRRPARGSADVVVISGAPGVGKTGLAIHWAHRAVGSFPDGQIYVDMRGYGTQRPLPPAEALAGALRALGVARPEELTSIDERAARYRTLLSDRRVLVVLDNARSVAQVQALMPGIGRSVVLVTSRHELGGLAVRFAATHVRLSPLPRSDAVELLRASIGDRVASEPESAVQLAAYCANLPLALRIAAERAGARPALGLGDLVAELADERARLDVLDSGDPYSAVRSVFSWSYRGLDEVGASAFRALGAHPGPTFDVAAVTALTGASTAATNRAVQALADAHLIAEHAPGRYTMHDLLRVYARELAGERPDELRLHRLCLFDHYLHSSDHADCLLTPHRFRICLEGNEGAGLTFGDAVAARQWLEQEQENLVALCRIDDPELDSRRWQLAYVLRGYFYLTKRLDGWMDTHLQALAASRRAGDQWAEAVTRNNLGMAMVAAGTPERAMPHYQQAERLFDRLGDGHGVSNALANQASVLRRRGSLDEALRYQQRALANYRRAAAKRNIGITLRSMARVYLDAGRFDEAVRCAQEAVDVALGMDHDLDIAQAFNVLGMAHHRAGDASLAEIAIHQAVEFSRRCGSRHEEARAALQLGRLAAQSGRTNDAGRWFAAALALYRELGSTEAESVATELSRLGER